MEIPNLKYRISLADINDADKMKKKVLKESFQQLISKQYNPTMVEVLISPSPQIIKEEYYYNVGRERLLLMTVRLCFHQQIGDTYIGVFVDIEIPKGVKI